MTDLTKIEKPFGLLDPETQRALEECGGPWETYVNGRWGYFPGEPMFLADRVYRQAPKPVTYPQPPWDVIDRRWEWFAKDEDNGGWFYEGKTMPEIKHWGWKSDYNICSAAALSFDYGTCDWKDSLVRRPK